MSNLVKAVGPDPRPDEELVGEVLRDPDSRAGVLAASALLERYQQRIFAWCYRYVRERERALDLTQDVLARIWSGLPSFGQRSQFSWWVFVITRNRCLNAVQAPSLLEDDVALADELASKAPGPHEALEQQEDEEAVRRLMMEHLDDQERLALWLCCFERMPLDRITEALGLETATGARGLLQRARRKLRAALDARPGERA